VQRNRRDTGQPPRTLSAWDFFRTVVWWSMIAGTIVIGLPAVVIYVADPGNENRSHYVAFGVLQLVFLGAAIGSWTARCKTTGERVFLCHCPWHSGE
jgi:hypothetical protein